jgi:methionyl-tRNA formyltransferase
VKCAFFGSPDFAAASLEALLQSAHQVVGVVTQPDRPAGRGLKLEPPAVKTLALAHHLPVHQPEKLNSEETYRTLSAWQPDILVVVAYGEFLGRRLLEFCRFPPVNVHPSLLPDLRGAAPMQWAVLKGYRTTGVSTQFMVKEMDAGDVLLQETAALGPDENSREVHDRLKVVGGRLLVQTLDGLENGSLRPQPQDPSRATYAPLLTKEQGKVRFAALSAEEAHNLIRGLYPWPGAYGFLQGKRVKFLRSRLSDSRSQGTPGSFRFADGRLFVQCRSGALELLEVQPEGKRPVLPREFENGIQSLPHQFDVETP